MDSHDSQTHKSKGPRRDPERRRRQNLQAQKKYREKKRQHLLELERLAASVASGPGSRDPSQTAPLGSIQDAPAQLAGPSRAASPVRPMQSVHAVQSGSLQCQNPHTDECIDAHPRGPSGADALMETSRQPGSDKSSHASGSWQWDALLPGITAAQNSPWSGDHFDCGCNAPHMRVRTTEHSRVRYGMAWYNRLADPISNHISCDRICIATALSRNCLVIAITAETLCTDTAISPFFQPASAASSVVAGGSSEAFGRSAQAIFRTLKPDLRPGHEQVTTNHHPYIDVLPFPMLRANLIKNIANIDEDEFFHDSLNGLICWGGTGTGRRDRNGVGSGTPWDSRSWEAKDWYIQKWWHIIGGEDSELVRQSRWWRAMRGEDEDALMAPTVATTVGAPEIVGL